MSSSRANASPPRVGVYTFIAAAVCAAALPACGSKVLTLGTRRPQIVSGPELLTDIVPNNVKNGTATDNNISNATLTKDMLAIFFSSNKDIWTAKRAAVDRPFDPPESITAISTGARETSPAISADGLTLWFATDRANADYNYDIWVSTRALVTDDWSAPVPCPSLNSPGDDLPRPPGNHGLVLPLSSSRNDGNGKMYEIFFATRPSVDADFDPPLQEPELPRPPVNSSTDPFLADDGLRLFYSGHPLSEPGDIFLAEHGAWGEAFTSFESIDSINTQRWKESDPWLSWDGKTLYFTSNRGGAPDADAGTLAEGGADGTGPDRIYRVVFDVAWMP